MARKRQRRAIAKFLKQYGFGKVYYGNKKVAWRTLNYSVLKRMIAFKPGDLVNDCDGLNHVIKGFRVWHYQNVDGGVVQFDQVIFEDGRWSCGCGGLVAGWTPERITSEMREYLFHPERHTAWDSPFTKAVIEALENNDPIVDDRGILLPNLFQVAITPINYSNSGQDPK